MRETAGDPECVVVVVDNERARLQFIQRLVDTCEVRARQVDELAGTAPIDGGAGVALVALSAGAAPEDPGFDVIHRLSQEGLTVFGYAHGADSWSLGARCRALIAGAAMVFDSARQDFAQQLRDVLIQHVRLERARRDEEDRVKAAMKDKGC